MPNSILSAYVVPVNPADQDSPTSLHKIIIKVSEGDFEFIEEKAKCTDRLSKELKKLNY